MKYGFQQQAVVRHHDDEILELDEPLVYVSRGCEAYPFLKDRELVMPAGLTFDGASIPRIVWAWMPSKTDVMEEGGLHDGLFRWGPSIGIDFMPANWLFWEALTLSDDGWRWQRRVMLMTLNTAGIVAWRKWRKAGLTLDDPRTLSCYEPKTLRQAA